MIHYFEASFLYGALKELLWKTRDLCTCEVSIKEKKKRPRISNLCLLHHQSFFQCLQVRSPGGITSWVPLQTRPELSSRFTGVRILLAMLFSFASCCWRDISSLMSMAEKKTPHSGQVAFPDLICTPKVCCLLWEVKWEPYRELGGKRPHIYCVKTFQTSWQKDKAL